MNWKKIGIGAGGVAVAALFLSLMLRWDHLQLGVFILTVLVALGDAYCLRFIPTTAPSLDPHAPGDEIPLGKKWQTVRLCASIAVGFLAIFILQVGHMLDWDNTKEKWLILVALLAFVAARIYPYFRRTVGAFENAHSQGLEDGKVRVYEPGFHFADPLRETFKDEDIVSTEQTKLDIDAKVFDTLDGRVVFSGHIPFQVDPANSHKRIGVEEAHINKMIMDSAFSSIREVVGTLKTTAVIKGSTEAMKEVNKRFTRNNKRSHVEEEYGQKVWPIQGSFERAQEVYQLAIADQQASILTKKTKEMKKLGMSAEAAGKLVGSSLPGVRVEWKATETIASGKSEKKVELVDAGKIAKAITDGIARILGKP